MRKNQLEVLSKIATGWRPLWLQLGNVGRTLERKGLMRVDDGPEDSADRNRLCAYLTEAGCKVIEEQGHAEK
jgi:hypothetical protein